MPLPPCLQVRIITPQGDQGLFDFLIVSTGLLTDARLRPELRVFAEKVRALAGDIRTLDINQLPYTRP